MNEAPDGDQLPYFGAPPARTPKPASEVPALRGKRVVLSAPEGFVYDMRAVSEIFSVERGRKVVAIASEEGYYRWMFLQQPPVAQNYPVRLVWVE